MAIVQPITAARKGRYGDKVATDATGKYLGIQWAEGGSEYSLPACFPEEMTSLIGEIDIAFAEVA